MWNTNISLKTSYKGAPPISVTIKSYCLRFSRFLVSALTFACILVLNFQEWCFSQAWNKADAYFISNHLSETSDFTNLYEEHLICLFNSQVQSHSISEALPLSKCRCRELHPVLWVACAVELKLRSPPQKSLLDEHSISSVRRHTLLAMVVLVFVCLFDCLCGFGCFLCYYFPLGKEMPYSREEMRLSLLRRWAELSHGGCF